MLAKGVYWDSVQVKVTIDDSHVQLCSDLNEVTIIHFVAQTICGAEFLHKEICGILHNILFVDPNKTFLCLTTTALLLLASLWPRCTRYATCFQYQMR